MSNLEQKNQFMFYNSEDGTTHIQVILENDTVWTTQKGKAEIFDIDQSGITKHLSNIFGSGELYEVGNVQKMHIALIRINLPVHLHHSTYRRSESWHLHYL